MMYVTILSTDDSQLVLYYTCIFKYAISTCTLDWNDHYWIKHIISM